MGIIEKLGITPILSGFISFGNEDECHAEPVREVEQQRNELLEALIEFVVTHIEMVENGDCGFWDPYKEDKVIVAIKAIEKACYPKKWEEIKELSWE